MYKYSFCFQWGYTPISNVLNITYKVRNTFYIISYESVCTETKVSQNITYHCWHLLFLFNIFKYSSNYTNSLLSASVHKALSRLLTHWNRLYQRSEEGAGDAVTVPAVFLLSQSPCVNYLCTLPSGLKREFFFVHLTDEETKAQEGKTLVQGFAVSLFPLRSAWGPLSSPQGRNGTSLQGTGSALLGGPTNILTVPRKALTQRTDNSENGGAHSQAHKVGSWGVCQARRGHFSLDHVNNCFLHLMIEVDTVSRIEFGTFVMGFTSPQRH